MNLFHRHFGIVREIYKTPLRLILAFGLTIGAIELIIMLGIDYLPKGKGLNKTLIDSLLLLLMVSPVIYFLIFRPMVHFISSRKIAEEQIKKSEEAYRNTFEYSPIAAAFWNVETRIIFWNKAAEATFGWTKEEVTGRKFTEFFIPESDRIKVEANIDLLLNNIANEVTINENYRKDGSAILCEWHNTIILDEQGKPATIISQAKDITQQKRLEQQLISAKENAEESERLKSAFLANMSHEIRTPLNSIIGFSELLTDPVFEEEQKLEFARLIHKGGNNLLEVITEIMDFSKLEAGKVKISYKSFSVNSLLNDLHKEYYYTASDKGLKLELELNDEMQGLVITSDEIKLRQILINLIGNALKFTYTGSITLGAEKKEDLVQFYVKDTGIGIPDDAQELIFDRFRQIEPHVKRKHGGIGLGLAISKNLVELLGGTICLESAFGVGTIFYFTIPLITTI